MSSTVGLILVSLKDPKSRNWAGFPLHTLVKLTHNVGAVKEVCFGTFRMKPKSPWIHSLGKFSCRKCILRDMDSFSSSDDDDGDKEKKKKSRLAEIHTAPSGTRCNHTLRCGRRSVSGAVYGQTDGHGVCDVSHSLTRSDDVPRHWELHTGQP